MDTNTRLAGRSGVVLVLVLFVIAFITVLAAAMLDQTTTDLAIQRNHTSGLKALYAAHAGLGDAIAQLREDYDANGNCAGTLTMPDGSTCTFAALVVNTGPVVTVTATGRADGFKRQVVARLVVGQPDATAPPYPVRVVWWREGV